MKKAFTLIELVAVIIILGVIGTISITTISRELKSSRQQMYEEQLETIKQGAINWLTDHPEKLPDETKTKTVILLKTLIQDGFVSKDIKNPQTEEAFSNYLQVVVHYVNGGYSYEVLPDIQETSLSCFTYEESGSGIKITAYNCYSGNDKNLPVITDVIIPNTINEKNVIEIGSTAFASKNLTSVILPDNLVTIGKGAFKVNQLEEIVIPDSVILIDARAFTMNQLMNITIPNSVKTIENQAFYENQITSVRIGNSVETIGKNAFTFNQLKTVTIPNSVTIIGTDAFSISASTNTMSSGITYYNNPDLSSIIIDNTKDSIDGEPWGADNATITYLRH